MSNLFKLPMGRDVDETNRLILVTSGFVVTAYTEHDHDATPPDKRDDGFWPSLDPASPGYIGDKTAREKMRQTADQSDVMRAWREDEWDYCGVILTVEKAGVELVRAYDVALWGVERNHPNDRQNHHITEVANELVGEALELARAKLKQLCECEVAA